MRQNFRISTEKSMQKAIFVKSAYQFLEMPKERWSSYDPSLFLRSSFVDPIVPQTEEEPFYSVGIREAYRLFLIFSDGSSSFPHLFSKIYTDYALGLVDNMPIQCANIAYFFVIRQEKRQKKSWKVSHTFQLF